MNKLKSIVCVLLMMIILAGCNQKERLVYKSDYLTITRTGAQIKLVDNAKNKTIIYTLHRVRRAKNAAMTARTILQEDDYKIESAGGQWIVTLPTERVYIKW